MFKFNLELFWGYNSGRGTSCMMFLEFSSKKKNAEGEEEEGVTPEDDDFIDDDNVDSDLDLDGLIIEDTEE